MAEIDNLEIQISADSQKASQSILALANSLSKLSGKTPTATANLTNLSRAIKSISGITKVGKLTESVEEISSAINKLNSITASDNIKNIAYSLSSLSSVSKTLGEFKIGKSLSNSVDILAETILKLNAIGSVENSVELLDSVENILQATTDFKQISDNINGLQIGKSFLTTLENLSFIIEYLNSIEDTGKFTDGVSNIAKAIGIFNSIEVNPAVASLARIAPVMADVSTALQSASSATVRFENLTTGLAKFAAGLSSISFTNTENIENIVNGLNKFNEIEIDESVTKSLNAIAKAVNSISNAKWNESAADNLRYFIDTLRVIKDDDIQRLEKLTDAANALKGVKISGLMERAEREADNGDSQKESAETETAADYLGQGMIKIFSGIGHAGSEAFKVVTEKAKELLNTIGRISASIGKGMISAVFKPITKIASGFGKAITKAKEFLSSIKRIAMYRAIRSVIKAITEGFAQGRENLYYYSQLVGTDFAKSMDMAATSFLYLKNSIGAATAPLTNYLVPILDKVIDRVVDLINKFNELTAVLTGASTWTRALKYPTTWKDSLDDANKSAKKLKTTMLGFDELNVIEPPTTGKSGSGFAEDDYLHMFEEVEVDAKIVGLTFDSGIFEPIASAWNNSGADMLDRIVTAWQNIRDLVGAVGRDFSEIWQNGTGQKSLENIMEIVGNIARAFGNLASSIQIAWDNAGSGKKIIQSIWNIANNLGTIFNRIWNGIADWAATVDFSPVIESLGTLFSAIERITDPDGVLARLFGKVWEKVLKPLATWTIEEGLPAAIDLLATAIDGLGAALEWAEPYLDKLIEFLRDVGSFTGDNIIGIMKALKVGIQLLMGQEVSDEDIAALMQQQDSQKSFFQKMESIGYGWFDDTHRNGVEDGVFTYRGGYDYEAGHTAFMKEKWDTSPAVAEFGNGDSFLSAWLAGLGLTKKDFDTTAKLGILDMSDFDANGVMKVLSAVSDGAKNAERSLEDMGGKFHDVVQDFSDGWSNLGIEIHNKWEGYKTDWADGMDSIKKSLSGFWENVKSGYNSIGKFFSDFWDDVKSGWQSIYLFVQSIGGKVVQVIYSLWAGSGGKGGLKGVINTMLAGAESFFNFIVNGINALLERINNLDFGGGVMGVISAITDKVLPEALKINVPLISAFNLPRLANGGIIDTGQIFIARESGAEMVGRYNGSTAVMNNDQIVEAVVRGVYTAVTSAMQNNGITGGGSNEVKVYLDGRQILARTEDIKREKGHTMFSGAYNP